MRNFTNKVYIIALDVKDDNGVCYMFSKRVFVHFPENAAKYSSRESAWQAYKKSDFYKNQITPEFLLYNKETGKITREKKTKRIG